MVASETVLNAERFESQRDLRGMQEMASRLWPVGPHHPGGLGWQWATDQMPGEVIVFRAGGELVGWAGFAEPSDMVAQADPAEPRAAAAVVSWVLGLRSEANLKVQVAHGDRVLHAALAAGGFGNDPDTEPWVGLWRDAGVTAPPDVAPYTIRPVEDSELEARVQAHRAAWRPADLPYHPDHRPDFPADSTSRYTAEMHARVRETWPYDPSLDLVVVAPDGSLAACCIGWLDSTTGVAEIEPVGVVPEHRRRGLAGAMCLDMAARVAERGGREVFINTGPMDAYPAPAGAYVKVGFRIVQRGKTLRL